MEIQTSVEGGRGMGLLKRSATRLPADLATRLREPQDIVINRSVSTAPGNCSWHSDSVL